MTRITLLLPSSVINSGRRTKGQTNQHSGQQKDNSKTICGRPGYLVLFWGCFIQTKQEGPCTSRDCVQVIKQRSYLCSVPLYKAHSQGPEGGRIGSQLPGPTRITNLPPRKGPSTLGNHRFQCPFRRCPLQANQPSITNRCSGTPALTPSPSRKVSTPACGQQPRPRETQR